MRAIVAHEPGKPNVLVIEERPIPEPDDGWVLIRVGAFGLNRAEMFTRQGHSPGILFPRVLGIECVGEVVAAPGTDLENGQRVAAMMGGMGRDFDGSYAEYACVPRRCVHPIVSDRPGARSARSRRCSRRRSDRCIPRSNADPATSSS